MRRITEAALLAGSAAIAGLGAALVDFGKTGQIGWTPVVFLVVYGGCLAGLWVAVRRLSPHASPFLLPPATLLVALGLVEIYRLDPNQSTAHLWWVVASVVVAVGVLAALRWDVGRLMPAAYPLAITGLSLIVVPFLSRMFRGVTGEGTGLWLAVERGEARFLIQPFGLGLTILAIGLAGIHARWVMGGPPQVTMSSWLAPRRHLLLMAVVGLVTLPLLWSTGDLTAWLTVAAVSASVSYLATGENRVVVAAVGLTAVGVLLGLASPRVRETIGIWLDPLPTGEVSSGVGESLLAMGSGYLSGSGLGMGDPGLIPHATTDWILAALGEELGLAGTVAVIALHALVVAAGMGAALGSRDLFCKITAGTLSALLGLMFLAGAGGLERLLPPTRLGLPFLAFGGFPLLAGWLALALLLRISDEERGPL